MLVFTADIHGEWLELYDQIPKDTEALFICGDTQPIRFEEDLELIPGPRKYLRKGDFYLFWKAGRVPIPTYFFLGNHEPFLWLYPYEKDGPKEIIKNLWILRRSGVIELCGLKIAYLSRVFSPKTYFEGVIWNPERETRSKRSKLAGRFTPKDIDELLSAVAKTGKVDILALHENPNYCNDKRGKELYRTIVKAIQPQVILCGHMHISLREEFAGIPLIGIGQKEKVLQYELPLKKKNFIKKIL